MPTVIEATYRVVTPMFCGGADPEGSIGPNKGAELRLASFKGVLRFWWRALAWSRLSGNLEAIREREDALFGSAGGGQSLVSMRLVSICPVDGRSGAPGARGQSVPIPAVVDKGKVLTVSPSGGSVVGEGARYLGYGVMKAFGRQKGELTRPCLRPPFEFTVHFRVRDRGRGSNERQREWDDPESLADALTCLGTLGGMGAKSRKGYGSLVLRSLTVNGADRWRPPQRMDDLGDALASFRRSCGTGSLSGFPEYTAFSTQARHLLVSMKPGGAREPLALLDLVGRELMRYRSWGHKGKVLGVESEKNFKGDHDLMKHRSRDKHPRRIAFGLPHNYGQDRNDQVGPRDPALDRRASPLFIHIHQCGDDDAPVAVLSFLPARFLPKGRSDISVGRCPVSQVPEADLYRPVHEFLNRLATRPEDVNAARATARVPNRLVRKEPFGRVLEIES